MNKKLLTIVFVLCAIVSQLHGQDDPVRVIDHNTGKAVPFAHLKVTNLQTNYAKYYVTDTAGIAHFTINHPVVVLVSYVGYKNYSDTLLPKNKAIIRLIPEIMSIDELVVTAQYTPVSADKSLYKVKVINNMQIQKKAAYDLAGLLRTQMNIRLSQDGAIGTGMSMQGLSGENVKILINGVPVIGRLNGVIDLSQINLQQAQQVELIEGPMSVIYGSNALAGVINIISRENTDEKFNLNINSYFETVGVYNFDALAGYRRGKHSFVVTAGRNFFDGFSSTSSGRVMEWKPKRQVNADVDYGIYLSKLNIKAHLSHFDELLQSKGDLLPPYFEKAFDNYFQTKRTTGKLSFATKGSNFFTSDNSVSLYDRTRTLWYNNLSLLEKTHIEDDVTRFKALLSRSIYTYKYDPFDIGLQTGYDLNVEWADGQRIGNETKNITDLALFMSVQYKPVSYLSLQPGVRAAYNSRYKSPVVYAFHLKAGPFKNFLLRTSYSSGFRSPSLKELYMNFVDVNHNIIGNTELKAETSGNVQLAVTKKVSSHKFIADFEFNLFANNINNIITLAEMPDKSYTYVNLDIYKTRGYNLKFHLFMKAGLDATIGYGMIGNSGNTEATDHQYIWSPEVTSEVSYNIPGNNIVLSAFYKYTGEVPKFLVDESGDVTTSKIKDYHTLDVSLTKKFLNDHFTIGIGGKNLFDITNITTGASQDGIHDGSASSIPIAWGRTAFIKLSYDLRGNKRPK